MFQTEDDPLPRDRAGLSSDHAWLRAVNTHSKAFGTFGAPQPPPDFASLQQHGFFMCFTSMFYASIDISQNDWRLQYVVSQSRSKKSHKKA